jgi:elongation factor G
MPTDLQFGGVGFFQWQYDHLQEVPEKLAERVLTSSGNNSSANGQKNGSNGRK